MTEALHFLGLSLENYKAYRGKHHLDLDASAGLYYVRGINQAASDLDSNGAAKTTIFDAITWCLYGKTLRDERPGDSVEPWSGERGTLVCLTFTRHGDQVYTIERGRKPNLLRMQVRSPDDEEEPSFEEVDQAAVDQAIGLSYGAFLCTVILPQFGERFLDMRPEAQARLFSETLDLDLWLRASEEAARQGRAAAKALADLENEIAAEAARVEGLEENLKTEQDLLKSYAGALKKRRLALSARVFRAKKELADKRAEACPHHFPTNEQMQAATETIALFTDQRDDETTRVQELADLMRELDREIEKATAAVVQAKAKPGVCPTCKQPIQAGHNVHVAPTKEELRELELVRDEVAVELGAARLALKGIVEQVSNKTQSLAIGHQQLEQVSRWEFQHKGFVDIADQHLADARAALGDLDKETNPHAASVARYTVQLEDATARLSDAQAKQYDLGWQKGAYEYWSESYRRIRLQLIDDLLQSLESAANEHAEELGLHGWRLEFVTEKETSGGKLSRGFATLLYPPGHTKPVRWEAFCGVEVQIWQLAVRFAMSEMFLSHASLSTNLEILDEPTQHLSPGVVDSLMVCLQGRAERLGRQILVVEHHVLDQGQFHD